MGQVESKVETWAKLRMKVSNGPEGEVAKDQVDGEVEVEAWAQV